MSLWTNRYKAKAKGLSCIVTSLSINPYEAKLSQNRYEAKAKLSRNRYEAKGKGVSCDVI